MRDHRRRDFYIFNFWGIMGPKCVRVCVCIRHVNICYVYTYVCVYVRMHVYMCECVKQHNYIFYSFANFICISLFDTGVTSHFCNTLFASARSSSNSLDVISSFDFAKLLIGRFCTISYRLSLIVTGKENTISFGIP